MVVGVWATVAWGAGCGPKLVIGFIASRGGRVMLICGGICGWGDGVSAIIFIVDAVSFCTAESAVLTVFCSGSDCVFVLLNIGSLIFRKRGRNSRYNTNSVTKTATTIDG